MQYVPVRMMNIINTILVRIKALHACCAFCFMSIGFSPMSAPLFGLQFDDKTILIKLFLKTCSLKSPQPVLLSSLFEAVSRLKHG